MKRDGINIHTIGYMTQLGRWWLITMERQIVLESNFHDLQIGLDGVCVCAVRKTQRKIKNVKRHVIINKTTSNQIYLLASYLLFQMEASIIQTHQIYR